MNMRCSQFGSALLLSATIALGPAVQAAEPGVIHLAAAIGEESAPKPKQPTKPGVPAKTTPATAAKPAATTAQPPKDEPKGMATSTKVWIGVGVAALLAAAAGGGGGSSAVAPPHPVP
jgi:hypothetical protein